MGGEQRIPGPCCRCEVEGDAEPPAETVEPLIRIRGRLGETVLEADRRSIPFTVGPGGEAKTLTFSLGQEMVEGRPEEDSGDTPEPEVEVDLRLTTEIETLL